ncbi:MAG: DUF4118 domain-containing protein [Armatimonadetes bacterium]|nr:DUF4118 domain-containing protein [Armatimonadota bacterium]
MVFSSAVWWGRGPSITISVLSFLAVNFFFTVPYYTFVVASTQDIITLLALLAVAEMTSRLAARLREREADARRQAWEASTLHALSGTVSVSTQSQEVFRAAASRVVELLAARECAIYLADDAGNLHLHTRAVPGGPGRGDTPAVPDLAGRAFTTREALEDEAGFTLPLAVGEKTLGVLLVRPTEGATRLPEATQRLLRTFAQQLAAVIERLRLQQEAAEAEILRKTDELKSVLLSAVSHDLRTPLSTIRTASTALLQEGGHWDEDARRELLEMIDAEAARLSRLVGNLLDLSRIEAGALHPVKEWRDLREVIARAADHLHDRLREHPVVVDLPADLPLVPLDFTQIEDVLVNLLDNSARNSPEGTEIRVSARRQDSDVIVQVENQGPPIPVEAAARIFDRFHTLEERRRGMGLGLAICNGLVEAHGGRIGLERPGEPGARFAFSLPLEEPPAPVGERPSAVTP